jgi:hypothetical protein
VKFHFLFSQSAVLQWRNAVFSFLPNSIVVASGATLECGVALVALWLHRKRPVIGCAWLVWLALLLATYRVALSSSGFAGLSCNCLGELGRILYPSDHGDRLAELVLYGLLLANVCALLPCVRLRTQVLANATSCRGSDVGIEGSECVTRDNCVESGL